MVSRISREFQDGIIKMLLAISANRGDEVADACVRLSEAQETFDAMKFVHEISTVVANFHDVDVRQVDSGQLLFNVIAVANNNDLRVPAVTKRLDANFDPLLPCPARSQSACARPPPPHA